jgi:hypothetical protein
LASACGRPDAPPRVPSLPAGLLFRKLCLPSFALDAIAASRCNRIGLARRLGQAILRRADAADGKHAGVAIGFVRVEALPARRARISLARARPQAHCPP